MQSYTFTLPVFIRNIQTATGEMEESRMPLVITVAGSASGALIVCIVVAFLVLVCVIVLLKCKRKDFSFTSNVAYSYSTSQCTEEVIHIYEETAPRPPSVIYDTVEESKTSYANNKVGGETMTDSGAAEMSHGGALMSSRSSVEYNSSSSITFTSNVAYGSHVHVHKAGSKKD